MPLLLAYQCKHVHDGFLVVQDERAHVRTAYRHLCARLERDTRACGGFSRQPAAMPILLSMMSSRENHTSFASVPSLGPGQGGPQECSALDALLAMMSACA